MSTSELVVKLLGEIKRKASLHPQRHKNRKLRDYLRPQPSQNRDRTNQPVTRRKYTPKILKNSSCNLDFFTRLVNSSPKPLVLRSLNHPVSLHLLKLSQSSNYRSYRGLVLLSSLKIIREYCERNGPCNIIYTTNHSNKLLSDPQVKFDKVLIVSKKLIQRIGNLDSYHRGLLAEVPYPEPSATLGTPRLVLCVCPSTKKNNRISNSDLGTLIRSAQALQWQAVWVLKNGEIDLLDPVTIRSSQHSLSTIPYSRGKIPETLDFVRKHNLLLCHCSRGGLSLESEEFSDKLKSHSGLMLMIGNLPYELHSQSTNISVNFSSKYSTNSDSPDTFAGESEFTEYFDEKVQSDLDNSDPVSCFSAEGVASDSTSSFPSKPNYTLDDQVQTAIAMYLIKKNFFSDLPRSPFVTS